MAQLYCHEVERTEFADDLIEKGEETIVTEIIRA